MIIPKSQKKNGIDLYTDKILSEDTVFRINSSDDINGLIHLTLDLISNKDKIKMKRNSIKKLKKSFKNWSQSRIKGKYIKYTNTKKLLVKINSKFLSIKQFYFRGNNIIDNSCIFINHSVCIGKPMYCRHKLDRLKI